MKPDDVIQLFDILNTMVSNQVYFLCAVLGLLAANIVATTWKG